MNEVETRVKRVERALVAAGWAVEEIETIIS
jgi:hypothetical protein